MNILIIYLICNIFTGLFIKKRGLSCGLTGYCGKYPADKNALKIIALFNEERGKDSCGIFSEGQVIKGWAGNNPRISDLFKEKDIPMTGVGWNNIVIHTRKSTVGSHSAENCHPYEYSDPENQRIMWLVQNGTVENMTALCQEVGLDYKDYSTDTMGMGAIIYKTGNFDVFSKYKGAGAFMCWDNIELNTMWVYKGTAGGNEERPLYLWKDEKRQGIYMSSLIEPLQIISGGNGEIQTFEGNYLYKIVDGVLKEKILINRKAELHPAYRPPVPTFIDRLSTKGKSIFTNNGAFGDRAYWKMGRFWRSGNLLNGEQEISVNSGYFKSKKNRNKRKHNEIYKMFYFYNGIMLKDEASYNTLLNKITNERSVYAYELSSLVGFPFPMSKVDYQKNIKDRLPNYVYIKNVTEYENTWYGDFKNMVNANFCMQIPFTLDKPIYLQFKRVTYAPTNSLELFDIITENIQAQLEFEKAEATPRLPHTTINKNLTLPVTRGIPKEASGVNPPKSVEESLPEYLKDVEEAEIIEWPLEEEINLLKEDFLIFIDEAKEQIDRFKEDVEILSETQFPTDKIKAAIDLFGRMVNSFKTSITFTKLISEINENSQNSSR